MSKRLWTVKSHMYQSDYEIVESAVRKSGLSMSEWARRALLAAARGDSARDGLVEVEDALDRTLSRHLRRLAALLGVAAREAAAARKFAEAAQFVVTYPDQGEAWARRAGGQKEIVRRVERYAHEQVRRATDYAPRTPPVSREDREELEELEDELDGGGAA